MMTPKKKESIISEYQNTDISFRKLGEKYGVDYRAIHKWVSDRKPKSKQIKTKTKMRKQTVQKYEALLDHLDSRLRGFKSVAKLTSKFRVSAGTSKVLQNEGLLKKENGIWRWVGCEVGMTNADYSKILLQKVNEDAMGVNYSKGGKTVKAPKVKVLNPPPRPGVAPSKSDVIDLSALRKERELLVARIDSIDNFLTLADNYRN